MTDDDLNKIRLVDLIFGPIWEVVLHQQEYFKALLPLNTATLLITVTFWEKIVRIPRCRFLILIPLFSFAVSLASSLRILRLVSRFRGAFTSFRSDLGTKWAAPDHKIENIKQEMEPHQKHMTDIGKQIDNFQKMADYSYFFGLGSLLLFAVLSLVLKTSGCV